MALNAIYDNNEWIASVQDQKYVRLPVSAGPHHISSKTAWREAAYESIDIDVQPGGTYYASIRAPWLSEEFAEFFLGRTKIWRVNALSPDEGQTLMKQMTLQEQLFPPGTQ